MRVRFPPSPPKMGFLDFIFPKKCLDCGISGKYICSKCLQSVPVCGFRNRNFAIFEYKGVVRKAILALKYKFAYDIASELALVCTQELKKRRKKEPKNIILVPIPLYKNRENFRGFNQTEILGEKIAKEMGWKYAPDLLIKQRETKHQVGLKGEQRRKNLSGVFTVNPNALVPSTYNLVLFDDVYTTGTTINEASKALKSYSFKSLGSLTIAG